jgi:hypothetical protein
MRGLRRLIGRRPRAKQQRLAIPSYFYESSEWTRMQEAHPTVGLAILNPDSGPGPECDPAKVVRVEESHAIGLTVLGYVDTSYADELARPLALVTMEIDRYFRWYGVDGIFLDQTPSGPADKAYYGALQSHIRSNWGDALIVLNAGQHTDECFMSLADILVTFEGSYWHYSRRYRRAPSWCRKHASHRFWHLVYGAITPNQMLHAVALSRRRGAGWVYVTPYGVDPAAPRGLTSNPWAERPPDPYWAAQLDAVGRAG